MKNVNYRKNNILRRNLYKIFNIFLDQINTKTDIIILDIVVSNMKFVKIYFISDKNYNLEKIYKQYNNYKIFIMLIQQHLSIFIPKFSFIKKKNNNKIIYNTLNHTNLWKNKRISLNV